MSAVVFAAGLATMYAAHQVADHVFGQTDRDAVNKSKPGTEGWSANISHIVKYHFFILGMLAITISVLNLSVSLLGILLCVGFSAVTHSILDRRWPVRWILEHIGSSGFARMETPYNGMYLADQGLHYFCLWVSALLLTVS